MSISTITVDHEKVYDPLNAPKTTLRAKLRRFAELLIGAISGAAGLARRTVRVGVLRAWGTVLVASGDGTVSTTIGGVAFSMTADASDIITATTLTAAINASSNALIVDLVEASNLAATVTLASCVVGAEVNVLGYKLRGVKATLTGVDDEFRVGGTDTEDAAELVLRINSMAGLNELVIASQAAGVVTVRYRGASLTPFNNVLSCTGTGCTASGALLAATAGILVSARAKGSMANHITLVAAGTGMTASGARLTGGTQTATAY